MTHLLPDVPVPVPVPLPEPEPEPESEPVTATEAYALEIAERHGRCCLERADYAVLDAERLLQAVELSDSGDLLALPGARLLGDRADSLDQPVDVERAAHAFHLDPVEGRETNYAMINELYWYGEHLAGSFQIMHGDGVVQSATNIFSSMDLDGNEQHRFAHWPGGYDFTRPIHVVEEKKYHPFDSYTMDEQGRVYHTLEREEYLIQVLEPDGTPLFRIHRDWEIHRRTKEEKDAAKNSFRFGGNTKLPPISYDMADTDEAISNIEVVNGELLVWSPRPDRSENPDGPSYVSVFDLEGRLVEERHRNVPRDPEEDRILWLGDGRVVLVKAFYSAHAASTANLTRQHQPVPQPAPRVDQPGPTIDGPAGGGVRSHDRTCLRAVRFRSELLCSLASATRCVARCRCGRCLPV